MVATSTPATAKTSADKVEITIPAPDGDIQNLWEETLTAVAQSNRLMHSILLKGTPISFQNNVFAIRFAAGDEHEIEIVSNPKTVGIIQARLAEFGHLNAQVKFVVADISSKEAIAESAPKPVPAVPKPAAPAAPPQPKAAPAPQILNAEEFKNDPLIKKALELFRGHIVEVRAGI